MRIGFFLLVLAVFVGCVQAPTKTGDIKPRNSEVQPQVIRIAENTKVIDARSKFEYSMAHVPKSKSIEWQSFMDPETGLLARDLDGAGRRLARLGFSPQDRVVILGEGLFSRSRSAGEGEEGWMAWFLTMLGFSNIEMGLFQDYRGKISNQEDERAGANVPAWTASVNLDDWLHGESLTSGFWQSSGKPDEFWLMVYSDKRPETRRGAKALNFVDAKSFVLTNGKPNPEICKQVQERGYTSSKKLLVASESVTLRGLACYVLRKTCGFPALYVEPSK